MGVLIACVSFFRVAKDIWVNELWQLSDRMRFFVICRIYNYIRLMGILRTLWRGFKAITRSTFYLGSMYTFLAYFYVEEIKYRLKDTEQTKQINE